MTLEPLDLDKIFENRLASLGIDQSFIPGLKREIRNSFQLYPRISLNQINKRLCFLGWTDLRLDYHTFSLARESRDI